MLMKISLSIVGKSYNICRRRMGGGGEDIYKLQRHSVSAYSLILNYWNPSVYEQSVYEFSLI
jgi:hypothetical protein